MNFVVTTAKIAGEINEENWGQVYDKDGNFIILQTKRTDLSATELGKEILTQLIDKIGAVEPRNLAGLKKILDEALNLPEIISLTLSIIESEVLYVAGLHGGEVILKRGDKEVVIATGEESASGFIQKGDIILFSSLKFSEIIPGDAQKELLRKATIEEISENMAQVVIEKENSEGSAALIVHITDIQKISETIAEEVSPIIEEKAEDYSEVGGEEATPRSFSLPLHSPRQIFRKVRQYLFQEEFENEEENKSKKLLSKIALILLLVLFISIFFGVKKDQVPTKNDFSAKLELVQHKYDEATSLMDLNSIRARTVLSDARGTILELKKLYQKGDNGKILDDWLAKIMDKEGQAAKDYKLKDLSVFYDLNLLREGGQGKEIVLYKKKAMILDKSGIIYSLGMEDKKGEIIAGSSIKNASAITIHGGQGYILGSDGITQMDLGSKASKIAVKKDDAWGNISIMRSFGGNLYLVDNAKGSVWKYVSTESGFTERRSYLNPDVSPDLSPVSGMAIDGSLWLLSGEGTLKFTSGRPDQFSYKGLTETISSGGKIFTDDNSKSVYILDSKAGKVFVFDKDGTYQSAYGADEIKGASGLVVIEDLKKIFILKNSKIYTVDIK